MQADVVVTAIKESTKSVTYRGISSAWRASSPWISQKEAYLFVALGRFAETSCDGGGVSVLPGLTVMSPRVEVSKPQRSALTTVVL